MIPKPGVSKVFGFRSPIPYLSDLAFSAGINAGSRPAIDPYLAFLGGLRFTLDLPHSSIFSFTPRSSRSKSNPRGRATHLVWSVPLKWDGWRFKFRGFMDVTSPGDTGAWYVLTQTQFLLDLGALADARDTWFFGVEW